MWVFVKLENNENTVNAYDIFQYFYKVWSYGWNLEKQRNVLVFNFCICISI